MLPITVHEGRVRVGDRFSVSFQRTRRADKRGLTQPSVSRGELPAYVLMHVAGPPCPPFSVPVQIVIPCGPLESFWLGFAGDDSRPVAVKVLTGHVNAVTGESWDEALHDDPQDYLVTPAQTSWHGIRSGTTVRQFSGDPIEIAVYEPTVPIDRPRARPRWDRIHHATGEENAENAGQHRRDAFAVVPDPYGFGSWSTQPSGRVTIACVNGDCWRSLTGEDPPEPKSEYQGWRLP